MGLAFLVLRFFYHIFPKKNSPDSLIQAVQNDIATLCAYVQQIISSNPKKFEMLVVIVALLLVFVWIPPQNTLMDIIEDVLSLSMFSILLVVFAPQENPSHKKFPVEVFGFIYSIMFTFYSAGTLVFDLFYMNNFFRADMWLVGYIVTVISYITCIATLRRFVERELSKEEIIFLGMMMLTTLEFITYYGVGFFSGIEKINSQAFETNLFGDITNIINHGIFIASQSQILERSAMEIWGYIILNGTDVLTITVVLGYLLQKFMERK